MDRCGWIVWILHLVLVLGWWTHECGVEWAAGHGTGLGQPGMGGEEKKETILEIGIRNNG